MAAANANKFLIKVPFVCKYTKYLLQMLDFLKFVRNL
jgi:hypothetical protein